MLALRFAQRHVLAPVLLALAALAILSDAHALAADAPVSAGHVSAADRLDCSAATDDTPRLRELIEAGGAAAGRTLFVPSGCRILLGSPGAGKSVADVASDTTIT